MSRLLQTTRMAASALLANPFRTMLTTLGIVIGITAVILLTALGSGVQEQITNQIGGLGATTLQVNPGAVRTGGPGSQLSGTATSTLTLNDARLVATLPEVTAASPVVQATAPLAGSAIALTGVDPAYASIRTVTLDAGRFIAAPGEIVLDTDVAKSFTGTTPEAALGQTITLRNTTFTVVGISRVAEGGIVQQIASSYIAIDDALRLANTAMISQIVVQASDVASVDAVATEIKTTLTATHGVVDFRVDTQQQLLDSSSQVTSLLTYLLAGIASISLIVGGIGIMNIMLVSVVERTREIGLRKALGATDGDVLTQFLLEAIFLSLGGGLLGVAAGVGLANLLSTISTSLPTNVTTLSVSLAFGVATAIGIIFGVLPAIRSARLQPVEALRYE